ncbi:MAG: phosphatidate cytidylyltransferase [Zoogloeaceae bacterium]|jgi:phosphatidate cytidylyltransferase|nr:phosphatidate cytidylyltransferase [Zoogloeaceae bacterium]
MQSPYLIYGKRPRGLVIFWPRLLLALGVGLILAIWAAFIILREAHPGLLLWTLGVVWVSDISAYFAGRKFGGRKLAPEISPGKTWAGVYGALAGILVYWLATTTLMIMEWGASYVFSRGFSLFFSLAFPIILAVLSILGDLFESLLKRQVGVKDSGNLLPGHGGALDRIDSLMAALPCAAFVVCLLPSLALPW